MISMPNVVSDRRAEIDAHATRVERELQEHIDDHGRLAVVQAPPGSGKTWLLLKLVNGAFARRLRIAIATQTNTQADDICRRMAKDYTHIPVIRFAGGKASAVDLGPTITWETASAHLPVGPCVVVGTAAKWGLVTIDRPFDVVFVEEAWQLSWADFMLLGQVAERFVLIGDPGQIPPVVSIDVARWETSPRPPHRAAPHVILEDARLRPEQWQLPASRRLPSDTVDLVRAFYDFEFDAYAGPGERGIHAEKASRSGIDRSIDLLANGSATILTIPTPDGGPPLEQDEEVAQTAADVVKRLLHRSAKVTIDGKSRALQPKDIGLAATHRVMNAAIELALPRELRGQVVVDTPERWQGLERPVMIVAHPLSGVVRPSAFDLETGRLCVMASRHLAGLVLVGRDHIGETLENHIPSADQAVGRPDVTGRGLFDNVRFWSRLKDQDRIVAR
jgi:hypothetical protein